jgi:hypothetical protein
MMEGRGGGDAVSFFIQFSLVNCRVARVLTHWLCSAGNVAAIATRAQRGGKTHLQGPLWERKTAGKPA